MKLKNLFNKFSFILLLIICASSCASLKDVSTYAANSQNLFQRVSFTEYGYYDYCLDSCYIRANIENLPNQLTEFECSCMNDSINDTTYNGLCTKIVNYYGALSKLSGNKSIDFSPLGKSLTSGTYGGVTISKAQSEEFNNFTSGAGGLVTFFLKTGKVKKAIINNHEMVVSIIESILSHVKSIKRDIELIRNENYTKATRMYGNAETNNLKWAILYSYKQKDKELNDALQYYNNQYKSLNKILDAENLLYKNVKNLDDKNFKTKFSNIISDIVYLNK